MPKVFKDIGEVFTDDEILEITGSHETPEILDDPRIPVCAGEWYSFQVEGTRFWGFDAHED